MTWQRYGPPLILGGFTVLATLLILIGSAPSPTGNVMFHPPEATSRIDRAAAQDLPTEEPMPRRLTSRTYSLDPYTCLDHALLACGRESHQQLLSRYVAALKLDCGDTSDCTACAAKLWNEMRTHITLAPSIEAAAAPCFAGPR